MKKPTEPRAASPHGYDENVTEASLLAHLDDELLEAWRRLRRFAVALGPQRVYASGRAIMFSKKVCYLFVRPRKSFLEVCVFLPVALDEPEVASAKAVSKTRFANTVKLRHADMLEAPLTDWIRDAWAAVPDA